MDRQSFIFHREWAEALKKLPKDVRVEVYDAIIEYGLSGTTSAALKPVADALFTVFRARLDVDKKRYEETVNRRREAGLRGGRAFALKCEQKRAKQSKREQSRANALIDNDIDNVVSNETNNNIENANAFSHCDPVLPEKSAKDDALPPGFAAFWAIYPRKRRVAKSVCLKKWKLHKLEAIAETIVADVKRQAESEQWTKDDGQYAPMPSTYLNQRRWEDAESIDANKVPDFKGERQDDVFLHKEKHRKFLIKLIADGSDLFSCYEHSISEADFIARYSDEIEAEKNRISLKKTTIEP